MQAETKQTTRSFGAGGNLYFAITFVGSIFLVIFGLVASKNGDWRGIMIVAGIMAALFLMIQVLRFRVGPDSFSCRTLVSSKTYHYADISIGYFMVTISQSRPQGTATFGIELKDGQKAEINLRLFPIGAAVLLFDELERHNIPIEVPDLWAAQRMLKDILKAKAKRDVRDTRAA